MRKSAAILALLLLSLTAAAQTLSINAWPNGYVALNNGWRVHAGDNPAYAQPAFDDSAWQSVSLDHQAETSYGWQWYRLRVQLPREHPPLALLIDGSDGTYEIYVNGRRASGAKFLPPSLITYPRERTISLDGTNSMVEIALRTFVPKVSLFRGFQNSLRVRLGTAPAIEVARNAAESARFSNAVPSVMINFLIVLCGVGILGLFRVQSRHKEYLWLGCYLILLGISSSSFQLSHAGFEPVSANWFVSDPILYLSTIFQIEFTFSFAARRIGKGWRLYETLLLAYPLLLLYPAWRDIIGVGLYNFVEALIIAPAAIALPLLLLVWYARGNREAGWLILPSLLPNGAVALYDVAFVFSYFAWKRLGLLTNFTTIGPVPIAPFDLADLLFLLAIGVVMFFRFTRVSREQARAAAELDAAREIQQRLVPASLPVVAGYQLEAAYFPAEEVGGDFYQILEQGDGSTLIVVGDVSGKGLKAAMTGTLAIGSLRTLAAEGLAPAALLGRLNRQIVRAQESGFITCICARISDETITIANAGHLSPYRNGEEMILESGLPLGILDENQYTEQTFPLSPGDKLTFLSDGVVEATDQNKVLFGFDRTQAISTQSAHAIAEAAKQFGQQDDISVLSVTRTTEMKVALA